MQQVSSIALELQQFSATSIHLMRLAAGMGVYYMGQMLQTVTKKNHLTIWSERVRACRSSGLTVKDWCAENEIIPNTYYRWQKKVFDAACQEQSQFYEVPLSVTKSAAVASIEINGVTVKVYHGADEETIRSVLQAIGHAE